MKRMKYLFVFTIFILLCSCGKTSDEWTITDSVANYQAGLLVEKVSDLSLDGDTLYMLKSDGNTEIISQFRGSTLLQNIPSGSKFYIDDNSIIVATTSSIQSFEISVYDFADEVQTDVEITIPVDTGNNLQCNDLVVLSDTILLTWTSANENYANCTYGIVGLDMIQQTVAFSHTMDHQSAGIFAVEDETYIISGNKILQLNGDTLTELSIFPETFLSGSPLADGTVLLSSETALYQWTPGTTELTELLNWGSTLLDSAPSKMHPPLN